MPAIRQDILYRYLCHAPMALALERAAESEIYRRFAVIPPVLDLGCGEGLFAEMIFTGGLDTGVEPDPDEIRNARRRGNYRELIQTTGDRIPKPDGHYRTIISNSVLEHIPKLDPVLREVYRLLHADGRFYFTAPSQYFDRYSWGHTLLEACGRQRAAARYRRFHNNFWRHYHYYALEGWIDVVRRSGFEVRHAFTFNPRANCLLNDALAPLGLPGAIIKRLTGRWVMCPPLRARLMKAVAHMFQDRIDRSGPCRRGGLVFMALGKSGEKV